MTKKMRINVKIDRKTETIPACLDHCLPVKAPPTAVKNMKVYRSTQALAAQSDP